MSKYKVGDKVRIVSEWGKGCRQNREGKMDKWLGKTMTIHKVTCNGHYCMEEDKTERDGIGWFWNDACIAGLANKFNVGERYKVSGDSEYEAGNIIEITGTEGHIVYYKTIKGEAFIHQRFSEMSIFAKNLIPVTEQNDSTKKIVITTDRKTTTAKMYDGKSCIKVSESRCCPSHTFDFHTGAKIAFDRLFCEPKNEFNWNAFKNHKLAVEVTNENIKSFLSEAENHGCIWRSGTKPTEWNPAEEFALEKLYLHGIKDFDSFGVFGYTTEKPMETEKYVITEW